MIAAVLQPFPLPAYPQAKGREDTETTGDGRAGRQAGLGETRPSPPPGRESLWEHICTVVVVW